jgi:hypothetical protein
VSEAIATQLDSARGRVYGGPLEDFVRRRDALARELRSAGERELAGTVKALRKPSRIAWALNLAATESAAIDTLTSAVENMLDAQAAGGDVRTAIGVLRSAVRDFAAHAERGATAGGQSIDAGTLANAVLAVLGRPGTLDQLRGGYLVEIPEAGGLDFLASLPAPPPATAPAAGVETSASAERAPASSGSRAEREAHRAAREAAHRAADALAEARRRSDDAQRAVSTAESALHAAESRVRNAEEQLRSARLEHERLSEQAGRAAAQVAQAERDADEAGRAAAGLVEALD